MELCTELRGLYCMDNQIEEIDISNNQLMTGLWCSNNPLNGLDLTQNPALEWVYCFECGLTELDVSQNTKMSYIECNTNPITELDVSHNPELEHLTCGSCELTELDVTNNPKLAHLDAFRNHFTELDVTHNPLMKRLDIWDNHELGSIDISRNPGLQYYNCSNNGVKTIDVSHNPELQKLSCAYNQIEELDLSNNPKLIYLDCAVNQLNELDLSKNPHIYFLQAFTNPFTTIDIGDDPYLVKTYNEGVKQAEYDVCQGHSWTIDYGGDDSTGGDSIFFFCVDDAVTVNTQPSGNAPAIEYPEDDVPYSEDLITREQAVQTLYEMAGRPDVSGLTSRFTDVEEGAWYYDALLWGEANSICVGYPHRSLDTFGVGKCLSRQDAVLMLMRYSEAVGYERAIDFGRSDEYMDYYDVDYDHWEAVCWSATWHIMEGKGEPDAPKTEQRIAPYDKATREEFQTMLDNLMEVNETGVSAVIAEIPEDSKPADKPADRPSDDPADEPVDKSDDKHDDPADVHDDKPDDKPADEPAEGGETDFVLGDVNFDGDINVTDLTLTAAHVKSIRPLSERSQLPADVNKDGDINVTDLAKLAAHVKGIRALG
ncbi:MAG: hypothetical protein IJ063_08275 [Ruminococcus sp.]|nr:hypothetical protein [Ruminococcus sp.]